MKRYYRVMLGRKSVHAAECFAGGFIGTDFEIHEDLSRKLPEEWRDFNKQFIPVFLANRPDKTKIGAGLACGALWTVSKGISKGDIVLCPDGAGRYRVGEITSDYEYAPGANLPHRRRVQWLPAVVDRVDMSEALAISVLRTKKVERSSLCTREREPDQSAGRAHQQPPPWPSPWA